MITKSKVLKLSEFVPLLALMISIVALSTDAMLPALVDIRHDFNLSDPNAAQLVITAMFFGLAVGQLFAGPLSDSFGRKPVIYAGYAIFIIGCILSIVAESFAVMLAGRVLQGLGAAAPRIAVVALIRDSYKGRAMAQVMSLVMAVFVLVPALAPAIGQSVMYVSHWRGIFVLFLVMAIAVWAWFAIRQPETLPLSARRVFSAKHLINGLREALKYRALVGYTLAAGFVFGPFIGYLSASQQVFQDTYNTGELFSVYFGCAALAIGAASVFNSKLVMRLGMRYLTWRALFGLIGLSCIGLLIALIYQGVPPLWMFMTWLCCTFFCAGIPFGNFNSMAMEPVGHMAGLGAAIVGALATFISLPIGWSIGAIYDGTVVPLIAGFAISGSSALAAMWWTELKQ